MAKKASKLIHCFLSSADRAVGLYPYLKSSILLDYYYKALSLGSVHGISPDLLNNIRKAISRMRRKIASYVEHLVRLIDRPGNRSLFKPCPTILRSIATVWRFVVFTRVQ